MAKSNNLQFKVSSGLKDIIGKDLITDDNIAVFELVKNSYDAHATNVIIHFFNISGDEPKIVIEDAGKGMNRIDLESKWLFLGYSAKRTGTEDLDYRDRIFQHRRFAGSNGIGRFSCDRLGEELRIETVKDEENAKLEILETDWTLFERSLSDEFIKIPVKHLSEENSQEGHHGTKLIITKLRSEWNRNRLITLKKSLSKLINPSKNPDSRPFYINIDCPDEIIEDKNIKEEYNKVNGLVTNFIFETLEIKTTKINVQLSPNGEFITTELKDGGTVIYRIKETNFFNKIKDINTNIFYLNKSAKQTFSTGMELTTTHYCYIFLSKNDIRIFPYGEPAEDSFNLDKRKAQKPSVYLGNKDLIGRIEIFGNDSLRETSSRGDGFITNSTYYEFLDFLTEFCIKRLERYVIDVQKWGDGLYISIEDENLQIQDIDILHNRIIELIKRITDSDGIIDVYYNEDFLKVINEKQSESAKGLINNLYRLAKESGNDELLEVAEKTNKRVLELRAALAEAERDAKNKNEELRVAQRIIKEAESENLFLKSIKSQDFVQVVSFIHHIGISSSLIDNYLTGIYNELESPSFNIERAKKNIKLLIFENKKILNISRFATKANFKLTTNSITLDIVNYIAEYIKNVIQLSNNDKTKIGFIDNIKKEVLRTFRPIEVNILIDNFLSNSKKAGATKFIVEMKQLDEDKIEIKFIDNGEGISAEHLNKIFSFGFTTMEGGSGIGLFHVKEIIDRLGGSIKVQSKIKEGTTFIITL